MAKDLKKVNKIHPVTKKIVATFDSIDEVIERNKFNINSIKKVVRMNKGHVWKHTLSGWVWKYETQTIEQC